MSFRLRAGQVENVEVRKPKCGNRSTETEVRKPKYGNRSAETEVRKPKCGNESRPAVGKVLRLEPGYSFLTLQVAVESL